MGRNRARPLYATWIGDIFTENVWELFKYVKHDIFYTWKDLWISSSSKKKIYISKIDDNSKINREICLFLETNNFDETK